MHPRMSKTQKAGIAIDKIPEYFLSHEEFLPISTLAIIVKDTEGLSAAIDMFAYALDGYTNISFETVKKEYEDEFGEASPIE